jgi:hypothetical protein
VVEIRDQNLALCSVIKDSELEGILQRTEMPGIALHPSGTVVYLPFSQVRLWQTLHSPVC